MRCNFTSSSNESSEKYRGEYDFFNGLLASVEGKEIQTLEGLPAEELDRYARAFAAAGALQCGFCTPGIVMRTKALLDAKGDALERDEAARFLGTHLCRCTGYVKILDAIETLAKGEDGAVELPRGLGTSGIKYEGCELAVGRRPFIDDMKVPGMLHGALKLTDHARAEIVSIDAARALEVSGVENVFTAADVPGRATRRSHPQRLAGLHPDWRYHVLSRRRARDRSGQGSRNGASRG